MQFLIHTLLYFPCVSPRNLSNKAGEQLGIGSETSDLSVILREKSQMNPGIRENAERELNENMEIMINAIFISPKNGT